MKRLFAVLASLIMMISLFSCGKKSEVASGYGDLIFESIEKETGDATRPPEYQNQPESDNGGNETVPPADAPVTTTFTAATIPSSSLTGINAPDNPPT